MRGDGLFERFLVLWFVVVFVFFSSSSAQLPHYLLSVRLYAGLHSAGQI